MTSFHHFDFVSLIDQKCHHLFKLSNDKIVCHSQLKQFS